MLKQILIGHPFESLFFKIIVFIFHLEFLLEKVFKKILLKAFLRGYVVSNVSFRVMWSFTILIKISKQ